MNKLCEICDKTNSEYFCRKHTIVSIYIGKNLSDDEIGDTFSDPYFHKFLSDSYKYINGAKYMYVCIK